MAARLTQAERAMTEPGPCTSCGTYAEYRNTAGQCTECHNRQYHEHQARRKAANVAAREQGRQWWAQRGIVPGDRVQIVSHGILGAMVVTGTAKVGSVGAYVHSPYQPGYLSPGGWTKSRSA
jgi:hypothetical protein